MGVGIPSGNGKVIIRAASGGGGGASFPGGDLTSGTGTTVTVGDGLSLSSGILTLSGSGNFRPYDANVIYAWKCDTVTDGGATIPASVGGVNLTTSLNARPLAAASGWCFQKTASVYSEAATLGSPVPGAGTVSSISIPAAQSCTLEMALYASSFRPGWQSPSDYYVAALGNPASVGGSGVLMSVQFWNRDTANRFLFEWTATYSGAFPYFSLDYGGALGQFASNVPHHAMITWDTSTNTVTAYLDGLLIGTSGGQSARTVDFTSFGMPTPPGVSYGDIRVSNIVRDQSYAIAATNFMRSM